MHPFRPFRVPTVCGIVLLTAAIAVANGPLATRSVAQHKPSPNDCLLYATVFTDQGWELPGADALIHPVDKTKPHWELTSNSRGEIAVRVPPVGDYEIEVKAKGYVTQTRKVTTIEGDRVDLTFRMVPQPKKKP